MELPSFGNENCSKLTKLLISPNLKELNLQFLWKLGLNLPISVRLIPISAMYDSPGLSYSYFMNLTSLGAKMGGVGS